MRRGNTWLQETLWLGAMVLCMIFAIMCGLMVGVNVSTQKPSKCVFGFPFQKEICYASDIQKVPFYQPQCRPSTQLLTNISHHYPCNFTQMVCEPTPCNTISQAFHDFYMYNIILGVISLVFIIGLVTSCVGYFRSRK